MCEKGEVDFVEAISQPFPLLVICDMMGIPRSEFQTVLRATNVILGAGDPDMVGDGDVITAMFEARRPGAQRADERVAGPCGVGPRKVRGSMNNDGKRRAPPISICAAHSAS